MPRPGNMKVQSKPKNFKSTMSKLLKSLGKFNKIIIVCMTLSLLSAIFACIAPNRLSGITDIITAGITPSQSKIKELGEKINGEMLKTYVEKSNITFKDESDVLIHFSSLSDEEKKEYMEPIELSGTVISIDEQIELLNFFASSKNNNIDYSSLMKSKSFKKIEKFITPDMNIVLLDKRVLFLAILYIISSIFSYVQGLLMAKVSNGYSKDLREQISIKINKLPLKYFDTHETGDILSRVTNDIDSIGMNINNSLSSLVSNVTLFLGSIVMMFITNWIMALTAIVSSLIGFALSSILIKKSQKYFKERQDELGKLNAHIEEIYSGHNVVKTYNGEDDSLEEFDQINDRLYTCNRKSQFLSGSMQPIMSFIGNLGYVAVCVVGAILVMKNLTNFGSIVAFMIYVRLFTNPLLQIAQAATGLQSTAAAAERVFEFIDEEEMQSEENLTGYLNKKQVDGNIEFKNVNFGYEKNRPIIKNFTASIKKGQKVAIVGPTGAGKTTLVNLLMKFYEIDSGDILIDGVSIRDLTRENIHDLFVMVLQDTWLFEGSIMDNIKFNKLGVKEDEIWESCKTVGVDHFIRTLPGQLNYNITDSDSVSQGQKQLLTIARGMIEAAPFLILDEATSNVDTRTECLVQSAMDKLTVGKTSFIIAHRLSTIKNADLILVLNDGNIVEQGTHEELMKKNGQYYNIYTSQFDI